MNSTRHTTIGFMGTLLYLILGLFYLHSNGHLQSVHILKPNELGDFLTGVFGPLAFLWLVLGYLQQGIELKQNTKALELQADELRSSVEQQRELVAVSKKQVEAELDVIRFEREQAMRALMPTFLASGVGGVHYGGNIRSEFSITIKNLGHSATDLNFVFNTDMESIEPRSLPYFTREQDVSLKFVFREQKVQDCDLNIHYIDGSGKSRTHTFSLKADKSGSPPSLKILPPSHISE